MRIILGWTVHTMGELRINDNRNKHITVRKEVFQETLVYREDLKYCTNPPQPRINQHYI